MTIIDLKEKYEDTWLNCLEDWSDKMKEAGDGKKKWYYTHKINGIRVKLAIEEELVVGMIQYIPIEQSYVIGEGLYFIYCIWVHGHKEGIGNQQHKGIGTALLEAAENDARLLGATGMAAWGLALPIWMKSSWYRKKGYKKVEADGLACLLWKPFNEQAVKPQWRKILKSPKGVENKVIVSAFSNGWCQVQNINKEIARKASLYFPGLVEYREYDTSNRVILEEWGISDGIYIDEKLISTGPPLSIERIQKRIARQIRKKRICANPGN